MKIQAVLYDMDGTLLDTETLHHLAWEHSAGLRGVTIGPEFYDRATGRNLACVFELLEELYPALGDPKAVHADMEQYCRDWMEEHGVPVLPGVFHTFGTLSVRGVRQCVCTSTSRASASRTLARAGLLQQLDALMCGDDITLSKPDPQIFLKGAEKLGVPIERCAVVEDSPMGIEAGLRSGAQVFIVPGLLPIDPDVEKRCTRVRSLWELPDLLK